MSKLTALTIKTKIILASTIVFGIALVGFATVIYHGSERAEWAKLEARLESHSEKIQTEIEEQVQDGTFPNPVDLNDVRTEGLSRVLRLLIDSSGRAVLKDPVSFKIDGPISTLAAATEPAFERIHIDGHRFLSYWAPVEVEEQNRFVLMLAVPMNEVDEELEGLRWMFLLAIPATLLLTALAIFLITRRALRPLGAMTETAGRISATNLSQRLNLPAAHDEVRVFAETFNCMIERLEAAFQGQRQFVADASHEIRTPLTVLNSELEYALKRVTDAEARDSIDASLAEIDRLTHMVEGLLLLARIDAHQFHLEGKRFRLDEVLIEVIQSLRRLADKKKVTITPFLQDAVELSGDGEMVRRALLNLIENAVKYSPPGSEVSATLGISADEAVSIAIQDRGPGISESDQKHIFDRFFRGENARAEIEGSGLGLAIARMLIELNGGSISLQSAVGQGTSVTVRFPLPASH